MRIWILVLDIRDLGSGVYPNNLQPFVTDVKVPLAEVQCACTCNVVKGVLQIGIIPSGHRLACTGSRSEGAASLDMLRGAPQEAERLEFEAELVGMVQVGSQRRTSKQLTY